MAYRTPKDLAENLSQRRKAKAADDGYVRETFILPMDRARATAQAFLDRWPAAAYMSEVEWWQELPGGPDRVPDAAAEECGLAAACDFFCK